VSHPNIIDMMRLIFTTGALDPSTGRSLSSRTLPSSPHPDFGGRSIVNNLTVKMSIRRRLPRWSRSFDGFYSTNDLAVQNDHPKKRNNRSPKETVGSFRLPTLRYDTGSSRLTGQFLPGFPDGNSGRGRDRYVGPENWSTLALAPSVELAASPVSRGFAT
jgi:hypothetical protein